MDQNPSAWTMTMNINCFLCDLSLFAFRSHEYHAQTMENCRTAAKMYKEKHGVDPNLAIALDTKGPEIRTGLLEGVSTFLISCLFELFSLLYFNTESSLEVFK